MDDYEALMLALVEESEDWQTRAVLADWCEEHGRHAWAECLRWMVRARKRPGSEADQILWFDETEEGPTKEDPMSDLPSSLYAHLLTGKRKVGFIRPAKLFANRRAAEEALLDAWGPARRSGWSPVG